MENNDNKPTLSTTEFKEHFSSLVPLILEEWPAVVRESLEATSGNLEQVVDQIAAQTDRTRTLIRRQLAELYTLAQAEATQLKAGAERIASESKSRLDIAQLEPLLHKLEERTEKLFAQFEKDVLPEVTEKAKQNLGTSLLTALGIGFLLGLLLGGWGRGRS
ncbi:hypothetical protein [Trichothermofontia sp.]